MTTKLTSENIERIITSCLFENGEDTSNHIIGEGAMIKSFVMPREMWGMFPGGMPYFVVNDSTN